MQLEYFILIYRSRRSTSAEKTIQVEAQVPQHNTIFEGNSAGYQSCPVSC